MLYFNLHFKSFVLKYVSLDRNARNAPLNAANTTISYFFKSSSHDLILRVYFLLKLGPSRTPT